MLRLLSPFLLSALLLGCSTNASLVSKVVNELQSQVGITGGDAHIPAKPDLKYRYLRVDIEGRRTAMMVLAFEEPHHQGSVEVWYSASGQVIKTQNGRVVYTSGLDTNWSRVQFYSQVPDWSVVDSDSKSFQRVRDEMPGYQFTLTDTLQIHAVQGVPPIRFPSSLNAAKAQQYHWFKESSDSSLPPSWYAWGVHRGQNTVVYSEQCLSASLCLKLQRWPVQEEPF